MLATAQLIYIMYSFRKVYTVRPGGSAGDEHAGESLGVLILRGEVMMFKSPPWDVVGYVNTAGSLACTLHASIDQGGPADRSVAVRHTPFAIDRQSTKCPYNALITV